ncbi:hypothetical protein OH77DRAFT_1475432 [Trametes cingulata]|nr:hypothetical protein OH77DRAFT_1475432 [Trametes cingulata]
MPTESAAAALKYKQQGNESFKAGRLDQAAALYTKAEQRDPTDPVYPSNLSAALFETGDYLGCASAVLRAWKLLRDQRDAKRDLILRLSARLAKALPFCVQSQPNSSGVLRASENDIKEIRDYALSCSPSEDLSRAWAEWGATDAESEERARRRDICLSKLSRLPLFMKHLDDALEYYTIGHDDIVDLTMEWGTDQSGEPLDIGKTPAEKLSRLSFLFGGVGDGRHALGTVQGLYDAYKKLSAPNQSAFRAHLTLLDIHPTAIARDLCMLMLLDELIRTTDTFTCLEIKATFMYTFCAAAMPSYCYDLLLTIMKDLSKRLSQTPPALPSWLHLDSGTIPSILRALSYCLTTRKSTRRMLAIQEYTSPEDHWRERGAALQQASGNGDMQGELRDGFLEQRRMFAAMFRDLPGDKLVQLPWLPPGMSVSAARAYVDAHMDDLVSKMQQLTTTGRVRTYEQEWFKCTMVFLPPRELRDRHPGFEEALSALQQGDDIQADLARRIRTHIDEDWKVNITLFDVNDNDPRHAPDGDGYKVLSDDPFEPVYCLDDFNKRNKASAQSPIKNDTYTLAWDAFDAFCDGVSAALRGLEGKLTVELIAGGLSEELAKMRFKSDVTRAPSFPRRYTRMWLSNVPDYTHGPMNMAIYVVPNLEDDPMASAACNCLLNTPAWGSDDQYFYTYCQLLSQDMPRFLGCRVIRSQAVFDGVVLGPLPLPRPLSALATRDELATWLTRVLFNIFIPGRSKGMPEDVRLPHNLVAFFGLLMHLHRVGFPAHWLSDFLGRVLSGSMVSDIAPYDGVWPIPVDDMRQRVPSRRVRTDPWLVEFENIIATAYHAIPFPVAGFLPADFSRDSEDIQVWEAKVTAAIPFLTGRSPWMGTGSPYEPVTRLLFYKPAEVAPSALIHGMRAVFEGKATPPPGTFFFLTAQELVQYDRRICFRLSRRRVERMKGEKWNLIAYRQDTGEQATRPVAVADWVHVPEGADEA